LRWPRLNLSALDDGRIILCEQRKFVLERWTWSGNGQVSLPKDVPGWLIPITGSGSIDAKDWRAGQCWHLTGQNDLNIDDGSEILFAHMGPAPLATILRS
jgi:mannose-6-phosphate isomerase